METRNQVIDVMLDHKSIRKYTDRIPSDDVIETIVRAGQQAPFAYQSYSIILSRKKERHPFRAPLLFTICIDAYKIERIMEKRNWKMVTNDLTLIMFGIEDASYVAQNMVTAARSLGLGSCFLGRPLSNPKHFAEQFKLPKRVLPIVQLAMGYPAENPPPRPRYPLEFTLFEDQYPELNDEMITKAMECMDKGYMSQEYYEKANIMISLQNREETFTFETYGWTEHISRKLGQWLSSIEEQKEQLKSCGFII